MSKESLNIAQKTSVLRRLMTDYPDLPLLVMAGENANIGMFVVQMFFRRVP